LCYPPELRFAEAMELSEAGLPEYLTNLEDYETRLASGEILW